MPFQDEINNNLGFITGDQHDLVLQQNEDRRTQIELLTKTISELSDNVKKPTSMLTAVFAAMREGHHTGTMLKSTDFPSLCKPCQAAISSSRLTHRQIN